MHYTRFAYSTTNMKNLLLLWTCLLTVNLVFPQKLTHQQYREDFDYLWQTIRTDYCYWDKKATDWERVKTLYSPQVDTITTTRNFVGLLERVLYEMYDHHASLNTNTPESQRLVPSGTDVWAAYVGGKPMILEVRQNSGAWRAGIRTGMELISFNDQPIEKAILPFLPKSLSRPDPEARDYALRVLLAGQHSEKRTITARDGSGLYTFYPDSSGTMDDFSYERTIEFKKLPNGIGYIRINNNLGDNALIPLFDSVLNSFMDTRALVLDLRETPSGGNTTVARAILSRFITKEGFYQAHELTAEERQYGVKRSWKEIVSPRGVPYTKALVVLADHWTGSVGEGIVIGFDALKRATIIGTPMARLNGAVYSYQLPHTGIGFSFPVEKLFHVKGTPREAFVPTVEVKLSGRGEDEILQKALDYLRAGKQVLAK